MTMWLRGAARSVRAPMRAAAAAAGGAARGWTSNAMGGGLRGSFSAGVRVLAFGALATAGSAGALLAANPAARAESSDLEEEASVTDRAIDRLGLGSWFTWAREPAERAGCPPGKLLPDPMDLPPGVIQRTLVLSLEDTLVHTEWDRKIGFRTRKRPGLDAFLAHMSQFYEIVIFTSALSSYGQPITDKLQEGGAYFQHALFNEHTKGNRIKDLSYLNRDLRHVIMVDTNPNSYRKQVSRLVSQKGLSLSLSLSFSLCLSFSLSLSLSLSLALSFSLSLPLALSLSLSLSLSLCMQFLML